MVVKVEGLVNADGHTGSAFSISYDDDIEEQGADDNEYEAKGTVSFWDGSSTFVLNMRGGATLNVRLDPAGAEIPDAGIEDTQFVEVKCTIEDPAAVEKTLIAFKVELEDGSGYEIEGPVEAVNAGTLEVLDVVYNTDPDITIFEDGVPVVGDFVEVEDDNCDGMADSVEIED